MLAEERFSQILALLAEKRTATVQELCEALNVSEFPPSGATCWSWTVRVGSIKSTAVPRCQAASSEPTSPRWKPRKHWPSAKKTPSPKPPPLLSRPMISSTWTPGPPRWPWHGPSAARRWTPTTSPTASPTRGCWRKKAAASLYLAACCAQTEAIIGAAAMAALQQYNFTKAFLGANGIDLVAGFTTPDPEEAAVKACAARRAREVWFLADDTKFGSIYPAVIAGLQDGSILTNRCPDPRYRQQTLVKEAEA